MAPLPAWADLSPALDRIGVSIGAFQTDPNFNVSANTPYGTLQSGDIALGKETVPRVKVDVMLFDSQGLSFDAYQYQRNYAGSIANNTNLGGTSLTTVGNAGLGLRFDVATLAYKWWLGSGDTVVGLGAGLAYYRMSLDANATASVNNATATASTSGGYSDEALAPLLGVGVRHAISPDLRLFADASAIAKRGGTLNGEIYNASAGVEWFPVKNIGVVLDYSVGQIDLQRDDAVESKFKTRFQGPSVFVKVRF